MNGIVRKEKLDALVRSDALDAIRKRKPLNPVLDGEEFAAARFRAAARRSHARGTRHC